MYSKLCLRLYILSVFQIIKDSNIKQTMKLMIKQKKSPKFKIKSKTNIVDLVIANIDEIW